MVLCNRIIYTSAITDKVRGYQVVAYSEGVEEAELKEVEKHSLPSKTIPPDFEFSSAIRLYRFSTGRIGISKLINTGVDEFGRPNRIYAYTLVIDEIGFSKIGYNPFIIDDLSPNEGLKGNIPPIDISRKPLEIKRVDTSVIEYSQKILENLLDREKVIVTTDSLEYNKKVMRDILCLIPPSIRADCSFSTFSMLVDEPYRVLFIPYSLFNYYSLPENYGLIDLVNHKFTPTKEKKRYPVYIVNKLKRKDFDAIKTFIDFLQEKNVTLDNLDMWYQYWINAKNLSNLSESEKGKVLMRMARIAEKIDTSLAVQDYKRTISLMREYKATKTLENILEELTTKKFAEDIFSSEIKKMDRYRFMIATYYEKFIDNLSSMEEKLRHYEVLEDVYKEDRFRYYNIRWKRSMVLAELGRYNESFKILIHLIINNPQYIEKLKPYLKKLEEENQYTIIRKLLINISKYSPSNKTLYKYSVYLISKSKKMITTLPKESIENFLTMLKIIPYYSISVSKDKLTEEIFTPCVILLPYAILHYAKKTSELELANKYYLSFINILFQLTTKPPEKIIKPTANYIKYLRRTKRDELVEEILKAIKSKNKKFYKEIIKYI